MPQKCHNKVWSYQRFTMPQTCHNDVWSYQQFTMPQTCICHNDVWFYQRFTMPHACHNKVWSYQRFTMPQTCHNDVWSYQRFTMPQTCHKSGASCWSLLHSSTIHTVVFRITYVSYYNNQLIPIMYSPTTGKYWLQLKKYQSLLYSTFPAVVCLHTLIVVYSIWNVNMQQ